MTWYSILSLVLTDLLRAESGLLLILKTQNQSPKKKVLVWTAAGSLFISLLVIAGISYPVSLIMEILLLTAAARFIHPGNTRILLFLAIFYEIGIGLYDYLLNAFISILLHTSILGSRFSLTALLAAWIVRLAVLIYLFAVKQKYRRQIISLAALLGFFGAVSLSEQSLLAIDENQSGRWILLAVILLLAVLFYRLSHEKEMEDEILRLKEEQDEIREREYQTLRRTYEDNARLYHDMHHHLNAIAQYLKNGDTSAALAYCRDLSPAEDTVRAIQTGDSALDALITSRIASAEKKHIHTETDIVFPRGTAIGSADLIAIFANLFDNAIEAAESADDSLRFIKLRVRRINEMLIIRMENGYGTEPQKEHERFLTSKADRAHHGWGMQSIRTAAEKHDGTVYTEYHDSVFRTVVTLSLSSRK